MNEDKMKLEEAIELEEIIKQKIKKRLNAEDKECVLAFENDNIYCGIRYNDYTEVFQFTFIKGFLKFICNWTY